MTILPYKLDDILKSYIKQDRLGKIRRPIESQVENKQSFNDIFEKELDKKENLQKISYSLIDIISKNKVTK